MLKDLLSAGGKTVKVIFLMGFIVALLLIFGLKGCGIETNKYDAQNTKTVVNGNIELQKMQDAKEKEMMRQNTLEKNAEAAAKTEMRISDNETSVELKKTLDVTAIEQKKLEMQDKAILDVNKVEQMKMELEMKKLELIEAQKLQNELRKAELEMEMEKYKLDKKAAEISEKEKMKAAAAARAERQKQKDIDIYNAILNN